MYIFNAVANFVPRVLSYLPYGARERETLGENPGNEVTRRSKILESFKAEKRNE